MSDKKISIETTKATTFAWKDAPMEMVSKGISLLVGHPIDSSDVFFREDVRELEVFAHLVAGPLAMRYLDCSSYHQPRLKEQERQQELSDIWFIAISDPDLALNELLELLVDPKHVQ